MTIAAVVVTYKNTWKSLNGVKKSLKENTFKEKDIYFSDNTKENLGYGGGINRTLKKILSKYDAFFIVNPDVVLHKDCIKNLSNVFEKNPNLGILGPKILDGNGKIWSVGGELDKKRYSGGLIGYGENVSTLPSKKNVDFISGTTMLIRKEVFEKIGLFAEDYFLYYEDVDFCMRAKKAGFGLVVVPEAEITHFASSTIGKNSPIMQYYMARNHLFFVERFGPLGVKLHELLRIPKTLFQARNKKYELIGIRDYFLRKVGKNDYWG